MTYSQPPLKQDENLAKNFRDLQDTVTHQDDMIKDLVRLIRMQNSEINTILQQQSKQAQEQEREQHRLSGIVDELNGRLASFVNKQSTQTAATVDVNKSQDKKSDADLISSLIAKVDALDATLRDHKASKDEALQGQIVALESKIDDLHSQISSQNNMHRIDEHTRGLNAEDLQSLTESLAKRQLSMQFQVDTLTETLNRQIDMSSPQHDKIRMHQKSKTSKDMRIPYKTESVDSNNSPRKSAHRHSRTLTDDDIPSFSSLEFDSCHTPSHTSTSHPSNKPHQDDDFATDLSPATLQRQITSLQNKTIQQASNLSSHQKDILNLKRRLTHAEKLIGARYRTGSFTIQGRSFYHDATSLRYIVTDQTARDTFKMFYGNRLYAIEYVDVAPPVVLAAFDMIACVRCRHEMWTDDKLEVKRQIRCVVEKIVDDWMKSLFPLHDGDGLERNNSQVVVARQLQREFNLLKVLCHRNGVEFDFALPC